MFVCIRFHLLRTSYKYVTIRISYLDLISIHLMRLTILE